MGIAILAATAPALAEPSPTTDDATHDEEFGVEDRARDPDQPPDPWTTVSLHWQEGLNYQIRPLRLVPSPTAARYERELALEGRIGLRLDGDAGGFFSTGTLPPLGTRAELRRFFIYTTGEFHLLYPFLFRVEIGLIGDNPHVDNVWIGAGDVPYLGTIRFGQFDAPMSFDVLTGSASRSFMEPAAPVEALAPGQKIGLQVADFSAPHRVSWQVGLFTDGQRQDVGDATDSPLRLVGRAIWRPIESLADGRVIHLGASTSYVLSPGDQVRYRTRPESFLAPRLLDSGDIDAKNAFLVGGELAAVRGPTSLQAEYLTSFVTAGDVGNPILHGGYLLASRFLTGETRPYNRAIGAFGRLEPHRDFDPCAGTWGAWEVAARVSGIDLDGGRVRGGTMWQLGGEVNWYWSRFVRLMFNYEFADVSGVPQHGDLHIIQGRIQIAI